MYKSTWILYSILLALNLSQIVSQCREDQDKLAVYNIIFNAYWSPSRFPKDYPGWRTPAQFGKLVGRTHDKTYSLFHLGKRLHAQAAKYIEMEQMDDGVYGMRNNNNVFDSFDGAQLLHGDGSSAMRAFFDNNHTLVSIMSRIKPSPDWFVGLDSFELCIGGNWIDSVTVELDPLDAGINDGVTFISPKRRTEPQHPVHRITSRYPVNLAGSFYYPNVHRLPPIATLTFVKLKEYTLSKVYNDGDIKINRLISDEEISLQVVSLNKTLDHKKPIMMEPIMDNHKYRYWTGDESQLKPWHDEKKTAIINGIVSSYDPTHSRNKKPKGKIKTDNIMPRRTTHHHFRIQNGTRDEPRDIKWLLENKRSSIDKNRNVHKIKRVYKKRAPRDCKLSDWGAWSACSRTCGVGETQRVRKIIVKARRGGKPCQSLKETKWCGSTAPCSDNSKRTIPIFDN